MTPISPIKPIEKEIVLEPEVIEAEILQEEKPIEVAIEKKVKPERKLTLQELIDNAED